MLASHAGGDEPSTQENEEVWQKKYQAYFETKTKPDEKLTFYQAFCLQLNQLKTDVRNGDVSFDDLNETCKNDQQLILAALWYQANHPETNPKKHPFTHISQALKSDRNFLLKATVIDTDIITQVSDEMADDLWLDTCWQTLSKIKDGKIREIAYTRLVEDMENHKHNLYPKNKKEILNLIDDYLISRSTNFNLYSSMPLKPMLAFRTSTPQIMTPIDDIASHYMDGKKFGVHLDNLALGFGKYTKIHSAYLLRNAIINEDGAGLSQEQLTVVRKGRLGQKLSAFIQAGKANELFSQKHTFASLESFFFFLQGRAAS